MDPVDAGFVAYLTAAIRDLGEHENRVDALVAKLSRGVEPRKDDLQTLAEAARVGLMRAQNIAAMAITWTEHHCGTCPMRSMHRRSGARGAVLRWLLDDRPGAGPKPRPG